jgi:hypothetical protein
MVKETVAPAAHVNPTLPWTRPCAAVAGNIAGHIRRAGPPSFGCQASWGLTMKKSADSKNAKDAPKGGDPIAAYSEGRPPALRTMCDLLRELIATSLPNATSKVWHGSPVWFIDDNPVVGYNATAKTVNLLFWNGRAFGELGLKPVGKYKAAQAVFGDAAKIDRKVISRWLKMAGANVFDSRTFFTKLREAK